MLLVHAILLAMKILMTSSTSTTTTTTTNAVLAKPLRIALEIELCLERFLCCFGTTTVQTRKTTLKTSRITLYSLLTSMYIIVYWVLFLFFLFWFDLTLKILQECWGWRWCCGMATN